MSGAVNNITLTNLLVKDNRNGVYAENNAQFTMTNSTVEQNRTGIQLSNTVRGLVTNNKIRDNQTHGLFYNLDDGTSDLSAFAMHDNSITGNWYSQILFRGANVLSPPADFECNWFGADAVTINTANTAELGYAGLVPQQYGGTSAQATYDGDIRGNGAIYVDYTPWRVGEGANVSEPFVPSGPCVGTPVVINSLATTDQTCATTGSITVNFSGGLTPYTIEWTGGAPVTGVVGSPYVITGLAAGNYSVTVTDMNGSNAVSSTTIVSFPVTNITATTVHTTIQAAIDAATAGDVLQVCAGTYTENINVNKALTINGPNVGIAGTAVRGAEAILSDCDIDITAAGNVTMDGFKVYQTNANSDVVSISGGTNATVQNNIFERFGTLTGQFVRAITTSSGPGLQTIQNNLFTGDVSGGLFGGHKTWQAAIYVNGAASTVLIQNNTFQNIRGALNLDDYQSGIQVVSNTFTNNGTHMSFGGVVPTTGSYVMGSNALQVTAFTTLFNLSNVNPNFRLDVTSSTFNGAVANTLPLASLFNIEAFMFHRGRSGRNGLVTYVANNEYVTSFALTTIQSAVDYANPGFVINLQSGTYNESAIVDKSVTIDGETSLCSDVVIEGGGVRIYGIQIPANTTNVILKDFKIQNTVGVVNGGIDAYTGNDGLNIDNVCLENTAGEGAIKLYGPVNGVTINNCEVSGSGVNNRGIVIWNGFKQNISITNNKVHDIAGCCGIELQDGNASAVTMTGNIVTKVGDSGMSAVGLNGSVGPNNISGNTITDCGRFGMEIKNPDGATTVNGNTITITTPFSTLKPSEERDIAGIAVIRRSVTAGNPDFPSGVTVTNNIITGYIQDNASSTSEGFGIVIEGINNTVSGNTLTNNDIGVQFQAGHLPYPADGDQADLADQYFGRGNAQQTCANTLGLNTFSGNGANTRNVGVGFGMVTNTNTSKIFCSIQAAIDDVTTLDGHTLTVPAGTYVEDVIVNKQLTITGPNAAISGCDSRGPEAIIVPATNAIASGEIFHVTASNVTISGFTIDGDNTDLTSGFLGTNGADINAREGVTVYVANVNNLTVTNNIFQNLSYFGVTLDAGSGSAAATSGHNISNNKFTDLGTYDAGSGIANWGGGVLLYNNQYAAVTDNCMTNVRLGVQTGNFSRANPGTAASQMITGNTIETRKIGIFHNLFYSLASPITVGNNTITGLAHASETTNWTGMLLASLSQVVHTASDNNIDASAIAITKTGISVWNDQMAPMISGGTITGVGIGINVNNFEGYPTAGSNAGSTAANISGTTITGASIAGIKVHDNPANSNGATVTATVGNTNTITGSPVGVWVVGSDATATVMGNNFTGNQVDIQVAANTGVVVASPNNNLSGSTFGIENLSANVVDGTLNYWGNASGPGPVGSGSGVNVTTLVNFCPWLNAPAPGDTAVYAVPGTISVTETGGPVDDDGSICASENVTLTVIGATGASTYLWSTGATTASIMVNPVVTTIYSVTVSYGGCSTVLNNTINVYPVPVISLVSLSNVLCNGGNTGAIEVVGTVGPAPYDYLWNTMETTAAISSLTAGMYSVTMVDANQCTAATANYTITEPTLLKVDNFAITNETCQACNDGTITVNASGGTLAYMYSKNGGTSFQSLSYFDSLIAGTYSMVVKDANGCLTAPQQVVITEDGIYPDLTPATVFSSTQFNVGNSANQVIIIKNIGSGPTTAPIVFRTTNFLGGGMSVAQNLNPSVTIFGSTYTLNNADFDMVVEGSLLKFTSKSGVVIPSGQNLKIGMIISRTGGGSGSLSTSVNIVSGTGGGELNPINNNISNLLTKL